MYSHVVYAFGYRSFPPIFAFMRPLIDQAKKLHFSGFEWHNFIWYSITPMKRTLFVDVLEIGIQIHKYCISVVCEKRLQLSIHVTLRLFAHLSLFYDAYDDVVLCNSRSRKASTIST